MGAGYDGRGFDEEGVGNFELEDNGEFTEQDGTFEKEGRKLTLEDV